MKVTITGNTCVLTSSIKVDDIKLVKKYNPEALQVKDDKGNEVFRIAYTEGKGSIAPFGITFGNKSLDGNGFAQVSGSFGGAVDEGNVKEVAADLIAPVQEYLTKLEATIPIVVEAIRASRKAIMDDIVVS
jgi:hypothetical protein